MSAASFWFGYYVAIAPQLLTTSRTTPLPRASDFSPYTMQLQSLPLPTQWNCALSQTAFQSPMQLHDLIQQHATTARPGPGNGLSDRLTTAAAVASSSPLWLASLQPPAPTKHAIAAQAPLWTFDLADQPRLPAQLYNVQAKTMTREWQMLRHWVFGDAATRKTLSVQTYTDTLPTWSSPSKDRMYRARKWLVQWPVWFALLSLSESACEPVTGWWPLVQADGRRALYKSDAEVDTTSLPLGRLLALIKTWKLPLGPILHAVLLMASDRATGRTRMITDDGLCEAVSVGVNSKQGVTPDLSTMQWVTSIVLRISSPDARLSLKMPSDSSQRSIQSDPSFSTKQCVVLAHRLDTFLATGSWVSMIQAHLLATSSAHGQQSFMKANFGDRYARARQRFLNKHPDARSTAHFCHGFAGAGVPAAPAAPSVGQPALVAFEHDWDAKRSVQKLRWTSTILPMIFRDVANTILHCKTLALATPILQPAEKPRASYFYDRLEAPNNQSEDGYRELDDHDYEEDEPQAQQNRIEPLHNEGSSDCDGIEIEVDSDRER